jgi:hypothetical protein
MNVGKSDNPSVVIIPTVRWRGKIRSRLTGSQSRQAFVRLAGSYWLIEAFHPGKEIKKGKHSIEQLPDK